MVFLVTQTYQGAKQEENTPFLTMRYENAYSNVTEDKAFHEK